jgi:hypothetical protein
MRELSGRWARGALSVSVIYAAQYIVVSTVFTFPMTLY